MDLALQPGIFEKYKYLADADNYVLSVLLGSNSFRIIEVSAKSKN